MKKIKLPISLFFIICMITGCDDLPDEQFDKYAVITRSGYHQWELPYKGESELTTSISIAVSGTSILSEDMDVEIAVMPENLEAYNFETFRYDSTSYYTLLPEDCYELESMKVTIKAGEEYGLLPLKIKVNQMDKYLNYILPVEIVKVSTNSIGINGYNESLINIALQNDYSGTYSMSLDLNSDEGSLPITGNLLVRTFDQNTSFFEVAYLNREKERLDYLVNMTVNPDSTLTLSAVNPEIEFEFAAPSKEEDREVNIMQVQEAGVKAHTMKFFLDYSYLDKSNPDIDPVRRYIKGFIIREIKEE